MHRNFVKNIDSRNDWKVGDYAKMIRNGERFWVVITNINDNKIKVFVDNDVINQKQFRYGHVFWTKSEYLFYQEPRNVDNIIKRIINRYNNIPSV